MSKDMENLKEIVEIARDGEKFYQDAEAKVADATLKSVFARMAGAKRELVASLSQRIATSGETPPQSGTLAGAARKVYTDIAAKFVERNASVFVSQLEETEDRLLAQVEKAAGDATDPAVRLTLQAYLPKVRACHDEMRSMKRQMAA